MSNITTTAPRQIHGYTNEIFNSTDHATVDDNKYI